MLGNSVQKREKMGNEIITRHIELTRIMNPRKAKILLISNKWYVSILNE